MMTAAGTSFPMLKILEAMIAYSLFIGIFLLKSYSYCLTSPSFALDCSFRCFTPQFSSLSYFSLTLVMTSTIVIVCCSGCWLVRFRCHEPTWFLTLAVHWPLRRGTKEWRRSRSTAMILWSPVRSRRWRYVGSSGQTSPFSFRNDWLVFYCIFLMFSNTKSIWMNVALWFWMRWSKSRASRTLRLRLEGAAVKVRFSLLFCC